MTISGATGGTFTLGYLGEFTSALTYGDSATLVKNALEGLSTLDQVAVVKVSNNEYTVEFQGALAGLDAPYLATLEEVLETSRSAKQATLWGRGGRKTSVLHAALINGTAAHALDFDDCSTTMGGHPSAPIVPVVLALAELQEATAAETIEAYLTGVEVCTRMARGLLPSVTARPITCASSDF